MADWSRDAVDALINAYKCNSNLYDPRNKLYHNRNARRDALKRVVAEVQQFRPDSTPEECQKKFQSLRSYYGQVKSKVRNALKNGEERDEIYEASVWWYHKMHFLGGFIQPRGVENLPQILIEEVHSQQKVETNQSLLGSDCSFEYEVDVPCDTADEPASHSLSTDGDADVSQSTVEPLVQISIPNGTPTVSSKKRKISEVDAPLMSKVSDLLDSIRDKITQNQSVKKHPSAITCFTNYIASALSTITDEELLLNAQHEIQKIVMDVQWKQYQINKSMQESTTSP